MQKFKRTKENQLFQNASQHRGKVTIKETRWIFFSYYQFFEVCRISNAIKNSKFIWHLEIVEFQPFRNNNPVANSFLRHTRSKELSTSLVSRIIKGTKIAFENIRLFYSFLRASKRISSYKFSQLSLALKTPLLQNKVENRPAGHILSCHSSAYISYVPRCRTKHFDFEVTKGTKSIFNIKLSCFRKKPAKWGNGWKVQLNLNFPLIFIEKIW